MGKLIQLIFLGFLLFSCESHILVDKTELKQIYKDLTRRDSTTRYFLIDSIYSFETKSISQFDTNYSIASSDLVNTGIWTNDIFDSAKIISQKYLDSMAKPDPLMRTLSHYRFSLPYFSKDKNSFIIYYNYYCGNLCAEYSLRLYKKIDGKWTFIKTYYKHLS